MNELSRVLTNKHHQLFSLLEILSDVNSSIAAHVKTSIPEFLP